MEGQKDNQDPPPRPLARHLSDADRLRKVIQELMDTEKSYVKVKKKKHSSFVFEADRDLWTVLTYFDLIFIQLTVPKGCNLQSLLI